jgi:hypothetical protein
MVEHHYILHSASNAGSRIVLYEKLTGGGVRNRLGLYYVHCSSILEPDWEEVNYSFDLLVAARVPTTADGT